MPAKPSGYIDSCLISNVNLHALATGAVRLFVFFFFYLFSTILHRSMLLLIVERRQVLVCTFV